MCRSLDFSTRRRRAVVPWASLTVFVVASALAGGPAANTRVSQDATGAHEQECSLAFDPGNANRRVSAYIDRPSPPGMILAPSIGASFSADGGVTWTDRQVRYGCDGVDDDLDGLVDEETFCDGLDDDFDGQADEDPCCSLEHIDPAVDADSSSGDFFVAFVAYEPNATSFMGSSYVVTAKSGDGGNSWTVLSPVDRSVFTPGGPNVDFLDKTWLAVDNSPDFTQGDAYVTWQRDDNLTGTNSDVFISTLTAGSTTWSTPTQVNDPGGPNPCNDAPYPVIDGAGDLWVVWRRNTKVCGGQGRFWVDHSIDGDQNFGPDMAGQIYTPISESLYKHGYRTADFPFLAVDPGTNVHLFVVYSEDPAGTDEADVMFTKSLDGGNSWSAPVRVNDDSTIHPQYFPVVRARLNANGWPLVDVLWQDERHSSGCDRVDDDGDGLTDEEVTDGLDDDGDGLVDEDPCDIRIDVYFARSVDTPNASTTFSANRRITNVSSGPPANSPNFFGDYVDLRVDGSKGHAVWTDTRNGDNDVYTDTIVDMDSDGDGALDFTDCAPADGGVIAKPGTVQNVSVDPSGSNAVVRWTTQDPVAGVATDYDVVTGLVSEMRADQDFSRASCLVSDHPDTPYTDTRSAPPSGDAYYYLLRAENSCGSGGYGQTGPADPRAALDGVAPCP